MSDDITDGEERHEDEVYDTREDMIDGNAVQDEEDINENEYNDEEEGDEVEEDDTLEQTEEHEDNDVIDKRNEASNESLPPSDQSNSQDIKYADNGSPGTATSDQLGYDPYQDMDYEDGLEDENDEMRDERARSNYIAKYKRALEERVAFQKKLSALMKSLAEIFKQSKKIQNDDMKPVSDSEERYNRYVREYQDMKLELDELLEKNRMQLVEMRNGLEIRQQSADFMRYQFLEHKMKIAQEKARFSRTGKPIPTKKLEELQKTEVDKYERVRNMRIQYFELKNTKQALDQSIKEKEEFSKGLHLIHYEQLKMENSSLSDKIEEKNESLQKAQLKSINAVHVWAHTREKLQFEQNQDAAMHARLGELENEIEQYKKDLTAIKMEQDLMKQDTHEMRNQAPLVTNSALLMDYEIRKNDLEAKQKKHKQLRETHKDYMRQIMRYESMITNLKLAAQSSSGARSRLVRVASSNSVDNQQVEFPDIHQKEVSQGPNVRNVVNQVLNM